MVCPYPLSKHGMTWEVQKTGYTTFQGYDFYVGSIPNCDRSKSVPKMPKQVSFDAIYPVQTKCHILGLQFTLISD